MTETHRSPAGGSSLRDTYTAYLERPSVKEAYEDYRKRIANWPEVERGVEELLTLSERIPVLSFALVSEAHETFVAGLCLSLLPPEENSL